MSGRRQSKETLVNNQIQAKKKPATSTGPVAIQPDLEELPQPLLTSAVEASIEGQAARLGDPRFSREGQSTLPPQISTV